MTGSEFLLCRTSPYPDTGDEVLVAVRHIVTMSQAASGLPMTKVRLVDGQSFYAQGTPRQVQQRIMLDAVVQK